MGLDAGAVEDAVEEADEVAERRSADRDAPQEEAIDDEGLGEPEAQPAAQHAVVAKALEHHPHGTERSHREPDRHLGTCDVRAVDVVEVLAGQNLREERR